MVRFFGGVTRVTARRVTKLNTGGTCLHEYSTALVDGAAGDIHAAGCCLWLRWWRRCCCSCGYGCSCGHDGCSCGYDGCSCGYDGCSGHYCGSCP